MPHHPSFLKLFSRLELTLAMHHAHRVQFWTRRDDDGGCCVCSISPCVSQQLKIIPVVARFFTQEISLKLKSTDTPGASVHLLHMYVFTLTSWLQPAGLRGRRACADRYPPAIAQRRRLRTCPAQPGVGGDPPPPGVSLPLAQRTAHKSSATCGGGHGCRRGAGWGGKGDRG